VDKLEFIERNWKNIEFGLDLKIYEDENGNPGRQYLTDVGYIDLLTTDKSGNFYVIELKKGHTSDKVIGQTLSYIGWVRKHLAKGKRVYN